MKTVKIILGVILGITSFVTLIQMLSDDLKGAKASAYVGAFIGFLNFEGLSFWLITSGMKKPK